MKPTYIATGIIAVSALSLAGCGDMETLAEKNGFTKEAQDNGLHLMSQDVFEACGSWSMYNKVFDDENKYNDIHYCTGELATPVYLYKGAYALSLNRITESKYFKTNGVDKSDVYVPDTFRRSTELAFRNNAYTSELYEDPVARFDEALDETEAEGVLVTQEQIDAGEWVQSEEDPDVLVNSNDNSLMYMGVLFASMAMMNNSSFYNSRGAVTQGVAVPASYMDKNTTLGYSNGTYYTDKDNIKKKDDRGTNTGFIAGGGSGSGSSGVVLAGTSAKTMTSAGKATVSGSTSTIKGGSANGGSVSARGGGGISSGAKGGGAS